MSHHKEARSEGACLRVVSGGLRTLRLFDAKYHHQVNGVHASGNNLAYVRYLS